MFKLSLKDNKDILQHLLNINVHLIFAPGTICSIHRQYLAFSQIELPQIKIDEAIVNDCSVIKETIFKAKGVDRINFIPELGQLHVEKPEGKPKIKQINDESLIDEAYKRVQVVSQLKDMEVYVDPREEEHEIVSFDFSNDLLRDMLVLTGATDRLELTAGSKLVLKNHTTGDVWKEKIPKSQGDPVSILLTETTQPLLVSALLSKDTLEDDKRDRSKIYIADKSFIAVINRAKTIITSTVG